MESDRACAFRAVEPANASAPAAGGWRRLSATAAQPPLQAGLIQSLSKGLAEVVAEPSRAMP